MKQEQRPQIGKISIFHIVVVSLSLLLTIAAWQFSKQQVETRVGLRFDAARDRALGLIADRMKKYEDALWAGVAAIESHGGDMSFAAWQDFAHNLRIDERYPGINGIGVIHYQTAQTLENYLEHQRQSRPEFRIFPAHTEPFFMPISFVEPHASNAAAVGLDVAHERNRRTAALLSRDTGLAKITGSITLVQDSEKTAGFLFYAPFYRGGDPEDPARRKESFLGAVYAPFVVHKLMEGLLAKELRQVRFSIRDGDVLIYNEHIPGDTNFDPDPMRSEEVSLELYGRNWRLDMRSDLAFRQENSFPQPTMILIAGLLIEGLIMALLFLLARANSRAIAYADRVTARLRRQSAKLEITNAELSNKNEELEQYAFVVSHDIKTPIRGIGGLAEMIQEDLEDYFKSPSANPEVSENLERIHDRVKRMEQLTRGILKFSRISLDEAEAAPLNIEELIRSLRLDFGLTSDQLKLRSDIRTVSQDTANFLSVLENLVGNAIKYHDDPGTLEIFLQIKNVGDYCVVSVMDNGPGIDPKYHDRIFDVFQTLRDVGDPESTGIGLAIVKKAVGRHARKVVLESAPGQGATFTFEWPNTGREKLFENPEMAA